MEFIPSGTIVSLSNPGVVSCQLLNPENSSSERVTACGPRRSPAPPSP